MEVYPSSGYTYESRSVSAKTKFVPDHVDKSGYDRFARALAPVRVPDGAAALALPTNVSFMQGYGARSLSMLNVEKNWADPRPEESMAVAIGVAAGEETFTFDINEKGSGPHGIIAGMTGSGKSETVQTWILAMAVKFPPEAVSFVLIDFKGTGLLLPFKNLPHLAGAISDLDVSITANLVALQHELTRRKELLDKNGVTSISAYRRLLRAGKASEPMPYLFVVIDEFAEFKLRFPEFMPAVNSIFAIGRALGVQIILLTQKPGQRGGRQDAGQHPLPLVPEGRKFIGQPRYARSSGRGQDNQRRTRHSPRRRGRGVRGNTVVLVRRPVRAGARFAPAAPEPGIVC